MPAPYPRCLYAGIVISVKFTVVNAEVLIQTFEQTERRDARASVTFPMFWEVSTALIGLVDPARSAARGRCRIRAAAATTSEYSGSRDGTRSQTIYGWTPMTAAPGAVELLPLPSSGRRFTTERKVRLSDASPGGRLRLDAVARYLQDVANDDATDVELPDAMFWIVRRTKIRVTRPAVIHERLAITTWCSGHGGRWAERRTQLVGDRGALIDTVSIWVSVDGESGAPKRLDETFFDTWGSAAGGRTVRARLMHPPPSAGDGRSWMVRYSDLDVVGHVNNAIYWAVLEEVMAAERTRGLVTAELEFADGIAPRAEVTLVQAVDDGCHRLWFVVGDKAVASACFTTHADEAHPV